MISRKLVEVAASKLPGSLRDRYLEEWRADLLDQPGAVAKLFWALGCFRSVLQLRRQAKIEFFRKATVELVFAKGETVMLDYPTFEVTRWVGTALSYMMPHRRWLRRCRPLTHYTIKFAMTLASLRWQSVGKPNLAKVSLAIKGTYTGMPRKVAVWHDGVLLQDLTNRIKDLAGE
jgi:hypothetical protein